MKKWFVLSSCLFLTQAIGAPCDGAPGAIYKNPDGTSGGFVAKTATVHPKVIIDSTSEVCDRARVGGNAILKQATKVLGSVVIEGSPSITSSTLAGGAKIFGKPIVAGSMICQTSLINFNVINSDYYCQTEDPEPRDPGSLADRTLLGIDSDVDGVRDDVEIWINNNTSNTPKRDFTDIRKTLKFIAKSLQSSIKYKEDRESSNQSFEDALIGYDCLDQILTPEETDFFKTKMRTKIYNTEGRFFAWAKNQGNLSGTLISNKRLKNACNKI